MPFWKAGKNDDQVLSELKETQKQNADEFVKEQEHAKTAKKSSLSIDNDFTPVEYDPQYILQVNHLKKYFPIKGGMVSKTVGYVKAVDGVTFNLKRGTTMRQDHHRTHHPPAVRREDVRPGAVQRAGGL